MMNTPICDFVRAYVEGKTQRLHMPGHKGVGPLGFEHLDITEISGADSLYEAAGIIRESEENAGMLFGCHTFYATEGSSQCIRAMLTLGLQEGLRRGRKPTVVAGRNAHRAFLTAAAMLDLQVHWLHPGQSYLTCPVTADAVDKTLSELEDKPFAVYLTSPDYLGNMLDIAGIANVCRRYGCLLLVDNAHGAYLRFLRPSRHPMDLGADICCDSAHKTLPVLTGGAYLHISRAAPKSIIAQAKNALALHGTTSPSYLILQSLDCANVCLASWQDTLGAFLSALAGMKDRLTAAGYRLLGNEPMKLTLDARAYGYTGNALAQFLRQKGVECEFSDPDYVVLMPAPAAGETALRQLETVLLTIEKRPALPAMAPAFFNCPQVLPFRQAMLAPAETICVAKSLGRILAAPSVGCPPAVPIAICGQRINEAAVAAFRYYGIQTVTVTEES